MTADWRQSLKNLTDRIDALSIRERALIFGGILAVLFVIALNLVLAPLRAEQVRLENTVNSKLEQTKKLQTEAQRLSETMVRDPDDANRERIADLKARLAAADESVAVFTRALVPPKETARLVEQILAIHRNVRVVRVENLPPTPLLDTAPAAGSVQAAAVSAPTVTAGSGLFRHGLRIELRANYLDIIRLLRAMETLPSRVFWGEVSIKVEKYPTSHATVVMYTLSQDSAWLGI